ncbi:hypothetical protein [Paenibacillus silagei]|uniref:Uncharacterized protein n=1 Tax=Paenibacillus silagei TaxID=1670801 RepID=A0ABS4NR24_9BACL|nr:hypothetical protein [Paenibacillus silagei]MBP2112514.1 hypothetical protein [Paenibacillus silagei]
MEQRKSSTARAALRNLLECFKEKKRIDAAEYLLILKRIQQLVEKEEKKKMLFLSQDQINFLLSSRIKYTKKQKAYKDVLSATIALSYYFVFDQDLIFKLKNSDVDIENRRVRNLRADTDNKACKWLLICDEAYEMLIPYILTRQNSSANAPFLYIRDVPANNSNINYLFSILKSKANYNYLQTTVDVRGIIRSRILNDLYRSEGKVAIDFLRIFGLKRSTQLENALEKFLTDVNSEKEAI